MSVRRGRGSALPRCKWAGLTVLRTLSRPWGHGADQTSAVAGAQVRRPASPHSWGDRATARMVVQREDFVHDHPKAACAIDMILERNAVKGAGEPSSGFFE
jgi:hypothetical protein